MTGRLEILTQISRNKLSKCVIWVSVILWDNEEGEAEPRGRAGHTLRLVAAGRMEVGETEPKPDTLRTSPKVDRCGWGSLLVLVPACIIHRSR